MKIIIIIIINGFARHLLGLSNFIVSSANGASKLTVLTWPHSYGIDKDELKIHWRLTAFGATTKAEASQYFFN